MSFRLILKNSLLVDPANQRQGLFDIGIAGGKIAAINTNLDKVRAEQVIDLAGRLTFPGLIDLHVHASQMLGGRNAHRMLARAGVTTALDLGGPAPEVLEVARSDGAGLNLAFLDQIRPGYTVSSPEPSRGELESFVEKALDQGALGVKILGGHFPLAPASTREVIAAANRLGAYVAFHAGTTSGKKGLESFREAVDLAEGYQLHLAHINSYCRGQTYPGDPGREMREALEILSQKHNLFSESYLSALNGTGGKCQGGRPESLSTINALILGGYEGTEEGLARAIAAGFARVVGAAGGDNVLLSPEEGLRFWRQQQTEALVMFPVNPAITRFLGATAKDRSGRFILDALATDGGGFPRNFLLEGGLALVKLQALTLEEFALKASLQPARILGLTGKGHLGEGADADVTVVDKCGNQAFLTVVGGEVIMYDGLVVGRGTCILTTGRGARILTEKGLPHHSLKVEESGFYRGKAATLWL